MTADERAAKLWEDLDMMYDTDDGIEGEKRDIARIAAAIRAAVQEFKERAAKVAEGGVFGRYGTYGDLAGIDIAKLIRELE